jgi:uncharacterized membrane protein YeaQ/YmgE (transglycosylase-associated protein family)
MDQIMQLGSVGIGGTILIGIVAGWIAEKITRSNVGLIVNLITGLIGSWIGFFVAKQAGIQLGEIFHGWFIGNVLVSAAGAVLLLMVLKMLRGSRRT